MINITHYYYLVYLFTSTHSSKDNVSVSLLSKCKYWPKFKVFTMNHYRITTPTVGSVVRTYHMVADTLVILLPSNFSLCILTPSDVSGIESMKMVTVNVLCSSIVWRISCCRKRRMPDKIWWPSVTILRVCWKIPLTPNEGRSEPGA